LVRPKWRTRLRCRQEAGDIPFSTELYRFDFESANMAASPEMAFILRAAGTGFAIVADKPA